MCSSQPWLLGVGRWWLTILVLVATGLIATGRTAAPRFFPDDPLQVDNDQALDAGKAVAISGSNAYDFARLNRCQYSQHLRHLWPQVFNVIARRHDDYQSKSDTGKVVLVGYSLVNGHQHIELRGRSLK